MSADTVTPRARPSWWHELIIGLLLFGFYLIVDALGAGRRSVADANADLLIDFERWFHLDFERALNDWLTPHETLTVIANYEYAFTYIISALLLLGWLFVRLPETYRRARDSFVVLNVLGITCFALFPVTPPRLMADLGYVDTVAQGGTVGSWGSPLVQSANQLAAMPSLHVAWALWVSVILARLSRGLGIQAFSAVHVAVTVFVILATANHYLVDAIAAVFFVWASVAITAWWHRRQRDALVPSADAFFLHVEGDGAPQHVGGQIMVRHDAGDGPRLDELREIAHNELGNLPRFRRRLAATSWWQRARWTAVSEIDMDWHVVQWDGPCRGEAGVRGVVARFAAHRMPLDRPLWRLVLIRDYEPGRSAVLILVHHCVGDGIETVLHAISLMRPRTELGGDDGRTAGVMKRSLAIAAGLAQLASDGHPAARLPAGSADHHFGTAALDLASVRSVARVHHARVTDLMLGLVASALSRVHPELVTATAGKLRVSVPLMIRDQQSSAGGNATAAVMVDIPLGAAGAIERLAEIGHVSDRLRTPTRALASRFVMARLLGFLPAPCQRWFASSVYGPSRFQAIVSNMPGPVEQLSLAGAPVEGVYPILPLAAGVPLAIGALSWNGVLGVGIAADPAVVDADALATELRIVLGELTGTGPTAVLKSPQ